MTVASTRFKDAAAREWDVRLDVAGMRRARARGVNLASADLLDVLQRLSDPVILCDAIFAIVEPQALKLGVTPQQFDEAISGDVLEEATKAMVESLLGFIPSPQAKRARELLAKARAVVDAQQAVAEAALANAAGQTPSGGTSSSAPPWPASTPTPGP